LLRDSLAGKEELLKDPILLKKVQRGS